MTRASSLTALVGSRICHDLVSPLGAIGNGVELLGLSGAAASPELALIEESVQSANARLKFFRIAYGAASDDQAISRSDIASILALVSRGGRLSYHWKVPGDQPKQLVRIAFLLLQCLETAMPYGGDITVEDNGEGWTIRAEADRLKVDHALWDGLQDPRARAQVSPAHVQYALLPEILIETGRTLAFKISDTEIVIRI